MSDISQGTVYVTAESLTGPYFDARKKGRRGANIYTLSDLLSVTGESKTGQIIAGQIQQNLFTLSLDERVQIYRKCGPVFGLITGRANRISGLSWHIKNINKDEDRAEAYLKMASDLFREFGAASVKHALVRMRCRAVARKFLPDLLDDFSNFIPAMMRWKRRNKIRQEDRCSQIEDWMAHPNGQRNLKEFTAETIIDMHTHGAAAWYKWRPASTGMVENVYNLPGGTVLPFRSMFVGGGMAWAQVINGVPPMIYFNSEISYLTYAPNSALSYGAVPLEALVNRIAEMLLFEEQAAMKADGTSAPEKLVVMNEMFPYGDEELGAQLATPMSQQEQSRIETLMNEPRRNAIRLLTGHGGQGTPTVVDLSRESTFAAQSDREDKILRVVAIVFNASNIEINLTGSTDTSGRNTSEAQQESDQAKGWVPVAIAYQDKWNQEILAERWGTEYELDSDKGLTEKEQVELEQAKMATGTYDINKIRTERGDEPYPETEYDRPPGGSAAPKPPDGTRGNPLMVRQP